MSKILIVEDEQVIRQALKRLLEKHEYHVEEADSVESALNFQLDSFDLIISDQRLPGSEGTKLITLAGSTPVLIMTSYASLQSAIDTMKLGAIDYIAKPFDHEQMLATVAKITASAQKEQADSRAQLPSENTFGIIGECNAMRQVFAHIEKAAPSDCNILVRGETGTGKELVAQAIHGASLRRQQKLISVNCAAIPESLIESELFGYAKGAFTGADSDRQGLIEAANGGTLFLDEIGELPLEAQARLLRFLQEGEIRRIGSTQTQTVDVRVISATHRNLKKLSDDGGFRQDLYFRLNVLPIMLPPLRERGKDILHIADFLLTKACVRLNKPGMHFSAKAIQALTAYPWPGNIRELENVIERSVILSDNKEINDQDLLIDVELINIESEQTAKANHSLTSHTSLKAQEDNGEDGLSLEDYFQRFILENQDQMSETELARKLGVSRKSLWERRKRLGIPRSNKA